jgi:hypothetical protein
MNRTPILWALGFVLASLSPGYAQEGETLIPPEVYRAAGLDKLTDSERKVLLDWLANEATSMERGSAAAGSQPVTNSTSGESASVAESRSPVTANTATQAPIRGSAFAVALWVFTAWSYWRRVVG